MKILKKSKIAMVISVVLAVIIVLFALVCSLINRALEDCREGNDWLGLNVLLILRTESLKMNV